MHPTIETQRTDAIRDLAAAQREVAAKLDAQTREMEAGRKELHAFRAEIKTIPASIGSAVGPPAAWCGIGVSIGLILMAWIKARSAT